MLYSEILTDLLARLTAHTKADGLLAGYRVVLFPVTETDGERDLPSIRALGDTVMEQWKTGRPTVGAMTVVFQVATVRLAGVAASTLGCEALMNAVETTDTCMVDPLLGGLLAEPPSYRTDNYVPTELSLTRNLTITLTPTKASQRGKR